MPKQLNEKQNLLLYFIKLQRVYFNNYIPPLLDLLKQRKQTLNDLSTQYPKYQILTQCFIILFFTYIENTAISIKRILINGYNNSILTFESKNKQILLLKDEDKLTFEDVMKITFSLFPSAFGLDGHYGNIKETELSTLFLLRDIRNRIIHPKGIEDFIVSLEPLNGEDINSPFVSYIQELQKVLNACDKNITSQ